MNVFVVLNHSQSGFFESLHVFSTKQKAVDWINAAIKAEYPNTISNELFDVYVNSDETRFEIFAPVYLGAYTITEKTLDPVVK